MSTCLCPRFPAGWRRTGFGQPQESSVDLPVCQRIKFPAKEHADLVLGVCPASTSLLKFVFLKEGRSSPGSWISAMGLLVAGRPCPVYSPVQEEVGRAHSSLA